MDTGQLLALMFEDLFKRLNTEVKQNAESALTKQNRAQQFDILRGIRQATHPPNS